MTGLAIALHRLPMRSPEQQQFLAAQKRKCAPRAEQAAPSLVLSQRIYDQGDKRC
jgi:hypothetical protein